MNKFKKLYTSLLLTVAAGLIPSGLTAYDGCCFNNIKIGADFLWWQPCTSDLDYAIVDRDSPFDLVNDDIHTKYIDPEWDPGFRVWIGMDDMFCGFNGAAVYTYFDTSKKNSAHRLDSVRLTTSIPEDNLTGNTAHAKWDLEYQTVDLFLSYPLQITCDCNFGFEAFSGLTWLNIDEKRHDYLNTYDGRQTFNRKLDIWGVGPVMGVKSSYKWNCLKIFGLASTTLLVGEAKSKDHSRNSLFENEWDNHYKNHDECVCFPGFHFLSGVAYDLCLCDMQIGLHLGWEYVHWINAPTFPYYEADRGGVRSANSEKSLTLQGLFAGVNLTF